MPKPVADQDLLEPGDGASRVALPPRFEEALAHVRSMSAGCHAAGIPNETLLAALLTELVPRLVDSYGAAGVANMLERLARELADAGTFRDDATGRVGSGRIQ